MIIRNLLPQFVLSFFLALGLFFATESAEAAPYTGAFRGLNSSASFAANGYRTGMMNPGSIMGGRSYSSKSYSSRRSFGFFRRGRR